MLRVASNALIVPPFECAWLSLRDYDLDGAFCLQFDCKGENDVTIILKPVPGAKRWQHYQRQQGPAGGEQLAVEDNYTVILGSHRNSKLKVEKNGDERATACGLPGCTVDSNAFTTAWINYQAGAISVGTGPAAAGRLTFHWADSGPGIPGIQHIGLSCWDRHVSYRNVVLLPPLPAQQLAEQHQQLLFKQQQQQQSGPGTDQQQQQEDALQAVPSLLQLVMESVAAGLSPAAVCHVLQLSELLLPRTQSLYDAAVQLAGRCFEALVVQRLPELAGLSVDVLGDILQEPLLGVSELVVFQAVAAWCQFGCEAEADDQQQPASPPPPAPEAAAGDERPQPQQPAPWQSGSGDGCSASGTQPGFEVARPEAQVVEALQLVRFAFMTEAERQAVLAHPFTRRCPLVQQLLQADLQRLQDSNGSSSPRGQYTFEQRRLVRPAAAAAAGAPAAGSQHCCGMQHEGTAGHSSSACEACSPAVLPGSEPSWHKASKDSSSSAAVAAATAAQSGGAMVGSSSGGRALGWGRWRRRLAPSCRELMYVCDGDRHGVLHFIATDYGTKQWVNPVLSKAVAIRASSPPSRYTDAKAIVSGQFLNTSFAGPRFIREPAAQPAAAAAAATPSGPADTAPVSSGSSGSQATPSTWWQLDLGPAHRLLVNYYTIRHDGSQDGFVRSWVLQGSNDLQHWIDLRRHRQDSTIRLAGQYGSWPVTGPAASMPFRAFRLLLLGPTTSSSSPWAFCLSHWELYGHFYKQEAAGDQGLLLGGGSTHHPPQAGATAAAAGVAGASKLVG